MRVITGSARGMKLTAPEGMETRPTTDMVKEALFSIIHFDIDGAVVLDLFAGSGQLGIEALSRGARLCVFADKSRECHEIVRANLAKTGLDKQSRVVTMDAESLLKGTKDVFDIILLDPPYAMEGIENILSLSAKKLSENGILVCETSKKTSLPDEVDGLASKKYAYGGTVLHVYRRKREE